VISLISKIIEQISIDDENASHWRTVGDVVDYLEEHHG